MKTENKSHTPVEIRDRWRTPPWLFRALDDEFHFTTDVAADDNNHLCDAYFTEENDALKQLWGDVNWCNPPYSNIGPWVLKAMQQATINRTTVMLLPSDTSVRWFRDAFHTSGAVRFISGRISFINEETGEPVSGNNKGSVLFIWDNKILHHEVTLVDRSRLMEAGE